MPVLDQWLGKNPRSPIKFATFNNVAGYCFGILMERLQQPDAEKGPKDFLSGFLAAKDANPDVVSDNEVIGYLLLTVNLSWSE